MYGGVCDNKSGGASKRVCLGDLLTRHPLIQSTGQPMVSTIMDSVVMAPKGCDVAAVRVVVDSDGGSLRL